MASETYLVPKKVWKRRYDHINAFEDVLLDSDVILLKFCLHVSRDEQYERLITQFPKNEKLVGALLKQGFAYAAVGDKNKARAIDNLWKKIRKAG